MEGYGIGGDKGKASGYGLVLRFTKPLSSTGHQKTISDVYPEFADARKARICVQDKNNSSTDGKDERTFAVIIYWPPENVSNVSSTCGHQKNRDLRPRLRWFSTDGTKENQGTELAQEKPFDKPSTTKTAGDEKFDVDRPGFLSLFSFIIWIIFSNKIQRL